MKDIKAFELIRFDETEMVAVTPYAEYFGWGLTFMGQLEKVWEVINMTKEEYLIELAKHQGQIFGVYKLSYFPTEQMARDFIKNFLEPRLLAIKLQGNQKLIITSI